MIGIASFELFYSTSLGVVWNLFAVCLLSVCNHVCSSLYRPKLETIFRNSGQPANDFITLFRLSP